MTMTIIYMLMIAIIMRVTKTNMRKSKYSLNTIYLYLNDDLTGLK